MGPLAIITSLVKPVIRDSLIYPNRITSDYRCEALNANVGSTNRSQHLNGQAAD